MEVFWIRTLQFILAITILVTLHEGGHFFFSKIFGVRVSRFYVFANWKFHLFSSYDNWFRRLLGKKLVTERDSEGVHFGQEIRNFFLTLKGHKDQVQTQNVGNKKYDDSVGTEYGIGWLPIGGYCQIDGMIDETQTAEKLSAEPQPWEFRTKPAWQRLLIMAGGVMVNFVLALVLYAAVLFTWGEDYYALKDMTMGMKFNSEAKALGFKDGDVLLGTEKGDFREFNADVFRNISEAHEVRIMRDGKPATVNLPGELNLLGMLQADPMFARPFIPCDVDSVMPGTPAAEAGLVKGDKIVAINEKPIDSWNEFQYQVGVLEDRMTAAKTVADSLKIRTVSLVVAHKSAAQTTDTLSLVMTPDLKLGVGQTSPYNYYKPTHISYGFLESIPAGAAYGVNVLGGYISDLKYVFTADGAKSLGGFGAIGSLFPPMWDWMLFWKMTAFISIILAFMNILPIPGLDGGHILFLCYEVVTGRTPSLKFQQWAQNIGMGLLLILMIVANLNDVLRWLGIM